MTAPRIGIIGTGNMGRIHARVLRSIRTLAAVADTDFERAKQIAGVHGVEAYDNYDEMIRTEKLDAVVISTPTISHASIAEDIAKNYDTIKAILIEKPLASTLKDAQRVAEIIRKSGKIALVSHTEIYNPIVNRAIDLIHDGAIGIPRTIIHDRRGFVQPSRIPSLGDVFEDLGVHDFDIMTRVSKGPAKLYAQCISEGGIFNSAVVLVKFKTSAEHVFHLSRHYAGRERYMDVSGTKGSLHLDLFAQIIRVKDLDQEPSASDRIIRLPERGATIKVYGEPIREVHEDFLEAIEKGKEPVVGLKDGVRALEIVEAARKSATDASIVDITI